MNPRDGRAPRAGRGRDQARPASESLPEWVTSPGRSSVRRRRDRFASSGPGGRSGGLPGIARFLLFALAFGLVVLLALSTVLRPLVARFVVDYAFDNPGAMRIDWVADFVREDLGSLITDRASDDPTAIEFEVRAGDTPVTLAPRLLDAGVIASERAWTFVAVSEDLAPKLTAGKFLLRRNMTPAEVADGLLRARVVVTPVTFREGLRLEQIAAKLQTLDPSISAVDPEEFYALTSEPPAALLEDYSWLAATGRPEGASLEGFLYPATYLVKPTTTAEDLVRMMLDAFYERVGPERMAVPEERGLSFYGVLSLASIVEREAVVDDERGLIAGVYQNRLDRRPRLLEADPTVIWAVDTLNLADAPFASWAQYFFWSQPGPKMQDVAVTKELAGYQTYQTPGLIPGPICTPTVASIDAALAPSTKAGYFFFVAIPDGDGKHAFAKTFEEHQANLRKYGYL